MARTSRAGPRVLNADAWDADDEAAALLRLAGQKGPHSMAKAKAAVPAAGNSDKNQKRVRELAGELARSGMRAAMFERFEPADLAQYCLDVATYIFEVDLDEE